MGQTALNTYLSECKKCISPIVFSFIKSDSKDYQKILYEYPQRMGKYLRPSLLLLSTSLHGGNKTEAKKIAAAIQISEEWLLVHDDAEDHSKERRSTKNEMKPSLNEMFGWEIAINVGDSLQTIMWKIIGEATKDLKNGWLIYEKINDVIFRTTEGQHQELKWIHDREMRINETDYLKMIDKKSAYYTIIGPLQLGALVAGKSISEIRMIEKFGKPLGRAFQLSDDLINLTVDSTIAGKEKFGDIDEGKRTMLLIKLLSKCSSTEREYINTIYRSNSRTKTIDEKGYVIALMKKYNIFFEIRKMIDLYIKSSRYEFNRYLASNNITHEKDKNIFLELIEFIGNRNH